VTIIVKNTKRNENKNNKKKQKEQEKQKEEKIDDTEPIRIKRHKPKPEVGEETLKYMIPKRKIPREWYENPGFVVSVIGILAIAIGILVWKAILFFVQKK